MPNPIARKTKMLLQVGLTVIIFWTVSSSLWSQEISLSQKGSASVSQPFAGYDESLTRAAELVLASAAETPSGSNGQADTDKARGTGLVVLYGPQLRPWSGGSSIAAARLELLRPAVEPILRSHGVPVDMVAVILVESGGRADALSPKGARGLWQLMPDTARRYGLRVDDAQDDRLDLLRATDAAARYLHDLYAQFGDWKLVLAAYNTGEANVASAILRAHTQDFDQLANRWMLPLETRNYVPRVLAAAPSLGQSSTFEVGQRRSVATTVFAVSNR
jgi:soluble lytic murein transglycosylase-like protein